MTPQGNRGPATHALTLLLGLISGLAGSLIAGRLSSFPASPLGSEYPSTERAGFGIPSQGLRIPPGWGKILKRHSGPHATGAKNGPGTFGSGDKDEESRLIEEEGQPTERMKEAQLEYEEELGLLAQQLSSHEKEILDRPWSEAQGQAIRQSVFRAKEDATELGSVDCRNSSCVATLTFPTPLDALYFLSGPKTLDLAAAGCKGYNIIPPVPVDNGPYDLKIYYACR